MNSESQRTAGVTLPNTEVRKLASSIVDDSFFRLHVALPAGYARTSRRYPVVYLTDGNAIFPLASAIAEGLSGGLFGLYALFHRPDTFTRYVISSPAVHHDDRVIMGYESDFAADHDDLPARLFISVGGREEHDDPLIDPSFHFESNVRLLAKSLEDRGYTGLRLATQVFEDESHLSVMPTAISRGLRVVFKKGGKNGE